MKITALRLAGALLMLICSSVTHAQSMPDVSRSPCIGAGSASSPSMNSGTTGYGAADHGMTPDSIGNGYVDANVGVANTDNATLIATDPKSDQIVMAGFDMDYQRPGRLCVEALGSVDWLQYIHNTYSGAPYGHLLASALWGRSSDLVQWSFQETFGEAMPNPLAAPTPVNVEYVNYFTTGPYLNLNLGESDRATLHALYSNLTYQRSPYDSENYGGGGNLIHAFSPESNLSLELDVMQTHFNEQAAGPTYDTRTASLTYTTAVVRTEITAVGGYRDLDFSGAESGAPLVMLMLNHAISAYSSLFANIESGFTTLGSGLSQSLSVPVSAASLGTAIPAASSTAPFKQRTASLGWSFQRARTGFSLYGSYAQAQYQQQTANSSTVGKFLAEDAGGVGGFTTDGDQNFSDITERQVRFPGVLGVSTEASSLNNTSKSVAVTFSRRLRPTLTLSLDATRSWSEFENLDASASRTYGRVSLLEQFNRLSISVYAERQHQSGSDPSLSVGGVTTFNNDLFGVYATYDIVGRRFGTPETGFFGIPGF